MSEDMEKSLSDEATFAGVAKPLRPEMSLSDERTLGGSEEGGIETVIDDIEAVDLEARYRIEGTLGQGGMGAVLLATDTRLDRKVAIKRIIGEAARSATAIQRFLTEAKAIAALNHPNIVQIYDYGRAKDGPFLIMEHVDGGSLADRCKQGALPLKEAIDLTCQLCDGLAKAHDAGIIHRDIKPANVLLSKDGLPKLTDFGLAKAETSDHGMTMTGSVMGTPDFMPPEQRRDANLVDHRSDLWSLAASVYQMVTGRSPKIIRFNDVPESLQDMLAKALEEEKEARYQSARDFRDALEASCQTSHSQGNVALVEGECPECHAANESTRRFCRGCGESLEIPCLACGDAMLHWDSICGACGAEQTEVFAQRSAEAATARSTAEAWLSADGFDEATQIALPFSHSSHPSMQEVTDWAKTFLDRVNERRREQERLAVLRLKEALAHEKAKDYISGAMTLALVPDSLSHTLIDGAQETVVRVASRLQSKENERKRIEAYIRNKLSKREYDELLPHVEKLSSLCPPRKDLQRLVERLRRREEGARERRIHVLNQVKKLMHAGRFDDAVKSLSLLGPPQQLDAEITAMRKQCLESAEKLRGLRWRVRDLISHEDSSELALAVAEFLSLSPHDAEILAIQSRLQKAQALLAAEEAAGIARAQELIRQINFENAADVLDKLLDKKWSNSAAELLADVTRLRESRGRAFRAIEDAVRRADNDPTEMLEYAGLLSRRGIEDPEFDDAKVQLARSRLSSRVQHRISTILAIGLIIFLSGGIGVFVAYNTDAFVYFLNNWGAVLLFVVAPLVIYGYMRKWVRTG